MEKLDILEANFALMDTDFAFEFYNSNEAAINALKREKYYIVVLSSVKVSEIIRACKDKRTLSKAIKLMANDDIIHIKEDISELSVELLKKYSLSHNLDIADAIIAATALYYDFHLATCNVSDFKFIPKLKLVKHKVVPQRCGGWLFR